MSPKLAFTFAAESGSPALNVLGTSAQPTAAAPTMTPAEMAKQTNASRVADFMFILNRSSTAKDGRLCVAGICAGRARIVTAGRVANPLRARVGSRRIGKTKAVVVSRSRRD